MGYYSKDVQRRWSLVREVELNEGLNSHHVETRLLVISAQSFLARYKNDNECKL